MKKLIIALATAGLVLGAAPAASASPWSPPSDPTRDVTHPVLRWVPKVGPSSVGSVREVRSVRTVRKAGER